MCNQNYFTKIDNVVNALFKVFFNNIIEIIIIFM